MFESRDPAVSHCAAYPRLLDDIGGTNARFGWQAVANGPIERVQVLPCAEHASLLEAAQTYLRDQALSAPPCAAFGIANPVTGDQVAMTNHHWKFSVTALREGLGVSRFLLLNDFTALALSLTQLPASSKVQVGGGQAAPDAAIGLIGPGTGLGVSGLFPVGYQNKWMPIAGEGGHASLTATTAHEFAAIQQLQKRYGHVSAERVISGAGLVDLYHALCDLKDGNAEAVDHESRREITTPAEVLERAQEVPTSTANEALDMFCGFLGSVAGDLALTLGARGGIYIGGGIVPRLGQRFDASPFRERFEAKGRFKKYLQDVPTWVIHSPVSPALQGASEALSLTQWA
jgi:glucokinase